MKCQACEVGDHDNCGMQTWCDCDCEGYDPVPDSLEGTASFMPPPRPDHVAEAQRMKVCSAGTAQPLACASCGEVSTNPGQFVRDGRWVCTESCRKELIDKDSYDDLAASGGIVDAP